MEQMVREIHSYRDSSWADQPIETIYLGGGTPSRLSLEQLEIIFEALRAVFSLAPVEVTMEVNPDDVSKSYLRGLQTLGIDRLSMGVQSFQPELLNFMNRAHNRKQAFRSIELIQATGFRTYNVDLMYGFPGQTTESLLKDVVTFAEFGPPHLSAYALTIESRTRLGKQVEMGRLEEPEDDRVGEMMRLVNVELGLAGLDQYEVSNFSKPGHEAEHNHRYWEHIPYLGLGPAAHSFRWDDGAKSAMRWWNPRDLKAYLEADDFEALQERESLSEKTLAEERIMLGLRTRKGINRTTLRQKYGYRLSDLQEEYVQKVAESGWLVDDGERFHCTPTGFARADALAVAILKT